MTATSTLSRSAVPHAWSRIQRIAALLFVIALFAVAAFAAGRASIDTHNPASITPPAVVTPVSAPTDVPCHVVGRPC